MSRSQTKTLGSLGVFYQTVKKTACKSLAFINKSVMLVKMSMDVLGFFWGGGEVFRFPPFSQHLVLAIVFRAASALFWAVRTSGKWNHEIFTKQIKWIRLCPKLIVPGLPRTCGPLEKTMNMIHVTCKFYRFEGHWFESTHTQTHHISDHSTYWSMPGICLHNNNQHVFCKSMASTSWSIRNCQGHQCL